MISVIFDVFPFTKQIYIPFSVLGVLSTNSNMYMSLDIRIPVEFTCVRMDVVLISVMTLRDFLKDLLSEIPGRKVCDRSV